MRIVFSWWFYVLLLAVTTPRCRCFLSTNVAGFSKFARPTALFTPRVMSKGQRRRTMTRLYMNFANEDPFVVLGLSPTTDKKEIKRAYKRMALKFHPDVVITANSTDDEKRAANDRFSKINWAYAQLSGKNGAEQPQQKTSSSSGSGYTPPHRRTTSPYSYSPTGSTDWRDYIPQYDTDEDYDAGGDSFGAIFKDLISGVAGGAVGGAVGAGGIFKDFVEFLEQTVDGYSADGGAEDADLQFLIQTGSLQDVANEMDDTQLIVQQLESKQSSLKEELMMRQADVAAAASGNYMEKMDMEEKVAELRARLNVVEGYLSKSRKRLLALQTRYKQLIVAGDNDTRVSGRSTPYDSSSYSSSSGYSSSSSSTVGSRSPSSSTRESSSSQRTSSPDSSSEDAWKHQGFGSSGRRSSSTRRRRRPSSSRQAAPQQPASSSYSSSPPPASPPYRSTSPPPSPAAPPRQQSNQPWTPPHRRTSADTQARQDKERLRQLQVDDEFDKLKKDLGL